MMDEHIATEMPDLQRKKRTVKVQTALEEPKYAGLLHCFQQCAGARITSPATAANVVASIYQSLSRKVGHGSKTLEEYQVSVDKVDIDVRVLSAPEARVLACIADFLRVPHEVKHDTSGLLPAEAEMSSGSEAE